MNKVLTNKQKIFIMVGVMLVMFLASLDMTVVATAMPTIIKNLNGTTSQYSWVVTIYMLLSTIAIPIIGKMSDIYGRKYFIISGVAVFLIGSALSGLSQDVAQLIIFRGLQGLGAGMIMGVSAAVMADVFPPKELGKYMGIMMSSAALASIIGPVLGGWITDNLSWRWAFYINIPFGILAIIVFFAALPVIKNYEGNKKVDYIGTLLTITTFAPLLLALTWGGRNYPWNSATIMGLLVFTVVSLIILITFEFKVSEPIIPIPFFKNSIFTISNFISFLVSVAMFGVIYFVPLFMQSVQGVTATNSGEITTPLMLSVILGSVVSGQLISRLGIYKILVLIGNAVTIAGLWLFAVMTPQTSHSAIVLYIAIYGFGSGFVTPSLIIAVQNAFPKEVVGTATASFQFFKNMGGSIGIAVLGAILANGMTAKTVAAKGPINALNNSIHNIFIVCIIVSIISLAASIFLKQIPIRKEDKVLG